MKTRKKAANDWWKTRELVIAEYQAGMKAFRAAIPALQAMAKGSFHTALFEWRDGDPKKLAAYVRSGRMAEEDWEDVAQMIESSCDRKPKRGRPQKRDIRAAAVAADYFYKRWLRINRAKGIDDWGHRARMREEAASIAIKLEKHAVKAERVLEFLARPNSRRNG